MRFFSLLTLLPLLNVAIAHQYCGTTTITKSGTHTAVTHAPAVTKTKTDHKKLCITTETVTETDTITAKSKVTETITSTPIATSTSFYKPFVTVLEKTTETISTCTTAPTPHKRSADAEAEPIVLEGMTNAERLRRGLPLARPAGLKRKYDKDHPQPSCVPSTSVVWDKTTTTKTVTPTSWTKVFECQYTKTHEKTAHTEVTITKTKTKSATVTAPTSTSTLVITPTITKTKTKTSTVVTGTCTPTA